MKIISQNNTLCFVIAIFKVHGKRQRECERQKKEGKKEGGSGEEEELGKKENIEMVFRKGGGEDLR